MPKTVTADWESLGLELDDVEVGNNTILDGDLIGKVVTLSQKDLDELKLCFHGASVVLVQGTADDPYSVQQIDCLT